MNMKTIKILSSHATLAEAVQISGYDVSYNPAAYASRIKMTDTGYARHNLSGTSRAYIVEGAEYDNPIIMFVVNAEGINLLHKFDLSGCLSDCDLTMCVINEAEFVITKTGVTHPKTQQGRAAMARTCASANSGIVAFA
jgi:hypothetical protein